MSKYSDQLEARYGNVGRLKKSTQEFKDLGLGESKNEDIKKRIKKMLRK